MIYGYARVSSKGQASDGNSLEVQEKALKDAGCQVIYRDSFTGTKMERPEFTKLCGVLKEGDRIVVTKLDRFARTASGGVEKIKELLNDGISIHILNMGLIENTPTGKLMVTMLLAFAEFERDNIVERLAEGKSIAKEINPDWREGRKEKELDEKTFCELRKMNKEGILSVSKCCEQLGISRRTWYNRLKEIA